MFLLMRGKKLVINGFVFGLIWCGLCMWKASNNIIFRGDLFDKQKIVQETYSFFHIWTWLKYLEVSFDYSYDQCYVYVL